MKIYIKSYGCSLNTSDSETMAGLLKQAGYKLVNKVEEADVVIVNTCIVKTPTETTVLKFIKKLIGKQIIIAGCMPQVTHYRSVLEKYSLVGTDNIKEIAYVVKETTNGNRVVLIDRNKIDRNKNKRLNLPKIRINKAIEIVPIAKGCLGDCSYCIVKQARGSLVSYKKDFIVSSVKKAIAEGVKEIWLTSQDCGAYGKDTGNSLPKLLKAILNIPGDFKVRLGMTNPNFVYEYLTDLIEIYKNEKIFKFLHVPVQSGSNEILKKMKRNYLVEDFRAIVQTFREEIPELTLATDIIVGFPGETDEQFKESLVLVQDVQPDVLNISRFFPRPGTIAEKMKCLPGGLIKDRSRQLTKTFGEISFERNKRWLGWQGNVIVDEIGKNGSYVGRNYAYKPVVLTTGEELIGKVIKVRVNDVGKHDLRGELL